MCICVRADQRRSVHKLTAHLTHKILQTRPFGPVAERRAARAYCIRPARSSGSSTRPGAS
jgi:hypothetical protein